MKRLHFFFLCIFIIGCTQSVITSKPNETYLYNIPSIAQSLTPIRAREIKTTSTAQEEEANRLFKEIFQFDQELAIELGRIPEFQDGVSQREILALKTFVTFLNISTDDERRALQNILSVGKPEYRKFCSPLQALFWLAMEGKLNPENNPLRYFSLANLLDQAWRYEVEYTKEEAVAIINNLRDKKKAKRLLDESKDDMIELNSIVNVYKKSLFDVEKLFEDKNVFKRYAGVDKWGDFNVVIDRLCSPELIDYYERRNFVFDYDTYYEALRSRSVTKTYGNIHYLFHNKRGICSDFALFTCYCLQRSGYNAQVYRVVEPRDRASWHELVVFEDKGKTYVLDNGRPTPLGIYELKGPLVFIPY